MTIAAGGGGPILGARPVRGNKGVEAASNHLARLIAQRIAYGAQLALEPQARPQERSGGIGAAVAELGKGQRHQRQPGQVVGQGLHLFVGLDHDADEPPVVQKPCALRLEPAERQDHRAFGRDRRLGVDGDEGVLRVPEGAGLKPDERRHRPPP
jgi:hypothetical protein